jgi:Ni/Co efflux regulator RcnB
MKKLTLIFALALFVAVTAANAQSDTSRTQRQSTQKNKSSDQMTKDKSSQGTQGSQNQGSNQNNDRTLVRSSDVPASLRQSLQGSDYNGWENGQVYKTKKGYTVEIRKNGMVKTHYFDANGQPIKDNKDNK